ncbi:MAG TPA: AAA family ATPase, partial [Gammaproteobacteria bacterium]|nr:AAA family ATPase [Gammaproteobacteria bacterium]
DLEAGIPAIHAALTAYLADFTDLPEAAPGLLLRLLARAPRAQVADLPDDPRQERAELQETLLALLAQLAGSRPVLLILEDIHWADSATLELTRELSQRLEGAPLFLAATARPPLPAEWPPSAWEVLPVPPLAPTASRALLEALAPGWQLSAARQADILAQAEGIPLFLEEMVRASVAGTPADGEAGTIPASLRDLLWARLEQLGPAKRLAQIAAALGREFRADWLIPITALEGPTVATQLERLESAGFLDRREHRDGTRFRFRHALYQEAAYASQLLRDRIAAHGRITTALLEQWPETARRQPDLVAHHAHEAEQWLTALGYSLTAGNAALEAAAPAEALTHFRNAETLAMETLAAAAPEDQRVKALAGVGLASLSLYGYGAEEANRAFHEAQALASADTEPATRFTILWGLWLGASSRSGYAEAEELARKLQAMAASMAAPPFLVSAHYALTNTRFMTGNLESALHHHEQARAAYRSQDHGVLVGTFGENTLVTTLAIAAWARCLSGRPQAAERGLAADLEWTESLNHPHTLAYLLTFGAMTAFYRGDPDAVAERTGRILALASANGFALWQAAGTALDGWVRAARGEAEGMEQVETSLAGMRQAMAGVGTPFLALLTDGYLRLGDHEGARRAAEETEGNIARIGDVFYLPEVLRVRGVTAATAEDATGYLQQAVDQARQSGALLLELRAATDLAARGRPEPLRAAWPRLPADEDSPDIRAAHAALARS